jgi:hypothetical protein
MKHANSKLVECADGEESNLIEFPLTPRTGFVNLMEVHLENLYASFGREMVLQYIMRREGLVKGAAPSPKWSGPKAA